MNLVFELSRQNARVYRTDSDGLKTCLHHPTNGISETGYEALLFFAPPLALSGENARFYAQKTRQEALLITPLAQLLDAQSFEEMNTLVPLCIFLKKLIAEAEIQTGLAAENVEIIIADSKATVLHAQMIALCAACLGLPISRIQMPEDALQPEQLNMATLPEFSGLNSFYLGIKHNQRMDKIECCFEKGCANAHIVDKLVYLNNSAGAPATWILEIYATREPDIAADLIEKLQFELASPHTEQKRPIGCELNLQANGVLTVKITDWSNGKQFQRDIFLFPEIIRNLLDAQEQILQTTIN